MGTSKGHLGSPMFWHARTRAKVLVCLNDLLSTVRHLHYSLVAGVADGASMQLTPSRSTFSICSTGSETLTGPSLCLTGAG